MAITTNDIAISLIKSWNANRESLAESGKAKQRLERTSKALEDASKHAISHGVNGLFRHGGNTYEIAKGPKPNPPVKIIEVTELGDRSRLTV